jgi:hypothetical protein
MVAQKHSERPMLYVLEFLAIEAGDKRVLGRVTHQAKTIDLACNRAKTMLKHVKVQDRMPDICEVKDQMGKTLTVVVSALGRA